MQLMRTMVMFVVLVTVALPGTLFAATGSVGTVETLSAQMVDEVTVNFFATAQASQEGVRLSFEYGTTPSFGHFTSSRSVPTQALTNLPYIRGFSLTPGVLYYYRAVLEGPGGIVYGTTRTFISGPGELGQTSPSASGNNTTQPTPSSSNNTTVPQANTNANQTGAAVNSLGGGNQNNSNSSVSGGSAIQENPGGFFQRLFNSAVDSRPMSVSVAMNPSKPAARDVVEYIVTYTNSSAYTVGKGTLSIVLPDSVVYLADNSGGASVLEKVSGGQKITIPTDPLEAKTKRSVTIMSIAGSGVTKALPTAVAGLSYTNAQGNMLAALSTDMGQASPIVSINQSSSVHTASVAQTSQTTDTDGGILPNSFFEWIIFLVVVTSIIVVVRRVVAVYQERKKRILEESHGTPAHA
jgi:hypothetical protein